MRTNTYIGMVLNNFRKKGRLTMNRPSPGVNQTVCGQHTATFNIGMVLNDFRKDGGGDLRKSPPLMKQCACQNTDFLNISALLKNISQCKKRKGGSGERRNCPQKGHLTPLSIGGKRRM
jgi:hypothetical protein